MSISVISPRSSYLAHARCVLDQRIGREERQTPATGWRGEICAISRTCVLREARRRQSTCSKAPRLFTHSGRRYVVIMSCGFVTCGPNEALVVSGNRARGPLSIAPSDTPSPHALSPAYFSTRFINCVRRKEEKKTWRSALGPPR